MEFLDLSAIIPVTSPGELSLFSHTGGIPESWPISNS